MTTRPHPHLKSLPEPPRTAPDTATVTGIAPGLMVRGISRSLPVADWLCTCGHHERARGRNAVTELTARARVGHCPHTDTETRRTAA